MVGGVPAAWMLLVVMHFRICTQKEQICTQNEQEEEEDYKLWPANKSDCSWQSLSIPAKCHSLMSN